MLRIGTKGRQETEVSAGNTAKTFGSGELEVFATPAMIALMEKTAWMSVADALEEGEGTVGTKIAVSHLSATPLGGRVWCESTLTAAEGRKLTFHVEAYDGNGKIGEGTHERFIVKNERFMEKAAGKGRKE